MTSRLSRTRHGLLGATLLAAMTLLPIGAHAKTVVRQVQNGGPFDPVTIAMDGPSLDEASGPNPFADYRLDVVFSDGTRSFTVPGYFAGCEDTANGACSRGKVWRAHFVPEHGGEWTYRVRFRTGSDIVATGNEGEAVAGDATSGSFTVGRATRNPVRARGLLTYTGESYYRWSGTGEPFFKLGPDSPENFLATADFDATPNYKNLRKSWAYHLRDFKPADAGSYTWGEGKGKGILGSLRYLHDAGLNSVSMLLFNVGGDDRNVIPQLMKVTPETYVAMSPEAQWTEGVFHDRYDVSKLAQWQHVLAYADELGLHLHFKLAENENDRFMDGGAVGRERKIYLREMAARFGHFLAVTWNLGEENFQETKDQADEAAYIASLNPYDHPLVLHVRPNEKERYRPLLGQGSALNGLSMQGFFTDFGDMRTEITQWRDLSRASGRPWVIGYDEEGGALGGAPVDEGYPAAQLPPKSAMKTDDKLPTRETFRRGGIWNALTAGSEGLEVYYGYISGCSDLDCQDHRTRAATWADGARALEFFRKYVGSDAVRMRAEDDLTFIRNDYVFAELGKLYIIYLGTTGITNPNGGAALKPDAMGSKLTLQTFGQSGTYSVGWYDALTGGELQVGSITRISGGTLAELGDPPAGGSGEWAIVVRRLP